MASLNFNKVLICGKLCADPDARTTPSGVPVTTFRVAVNRRYVKQAEDGSAPQQTADFFTVVAWRTTAEFVARYFKKGSTIFVEGKLQERQWTDKDNQKRYSTEIVADEVSFVDSKSENPMYRDGAQSGYPTDSYGGQQPQSAPKYSTPAAESRIDEVESDDDLPF